MTPVKDSSLPSEPLSADRETNINVRREKRKKEELENLKLADNVTDLLVFR